MGDGIVTAAHLESRRPLVDEERSDLLARPLGAGRAVDHAAGGKHDGEIGQVRVADEVFFAVENPVIAILNGSCPH